MYTPDSPVYEDYKVFSDSKISTENIQPYNQRLLFLSTTAALVSFVSVFSWYYSGTLPFIGVLYGTVIVCLLFIFPVILYAEGRRDSLFIQLNHGYDITSIPDIHPFFGTVEYKLLRVDPGDIQIEYGGVSMNPFTMSPTFLQKVESKQRDSAVCEICGETVFNGSQFETQTGGYFIEERTQKCRFGMVVGEKITGWTAYCSEHRSEVPEEVSTVID